MTWARKVDANQDEIVEGLRAIGAEVTLLFRVGQGVADLLVSYRQQWFILEVKRSAKEELTADQKAWIGRQKAPVFVVTGLLEAVDLLRRLTGPRALAHMV